MGNQMNRSRSSKVAAVALGLMILAAPALAAFQAIAVQGVRVSGSTVEVTVKNTSMLPTAGVVAVQAFVGDTAVWSFVPVALGGGQSKTLGASFGGAVGAVGSVSIQEDGQPF